MTVKRTASFSLDEALADPGFTPRSKDLASLLDRAALAEGELAGRAAAAAARIQGPIAAPIAARLETQPSEALAEMATAAARRPGTSEGDVAALLAALGTAVGAPQASRAAAVALAQLLADPAVRDALDAPALDLVVGALIAALASPAASTRRAAARALAAAGTDQARRALEETPDGGDTIVARARLAARRDADRTSEDDAVRLDRGAVRPIATVLVCRRGLELIVAEQLGAERGAHVGRAGRVELSTTEAPEVLLAAARSALGVGFPLPSEGLTDETPRGIAEAVARGLGGAAARAVFDAFAPGRVRFRVSFAGGGKHRATAWTIAEHVASLGARLVNDPRDAPWEVVVGLPPPAPGDPRTRDGRARFIALELRPRFDDRRFPWRVADVPAASHPTIAAAIAHLGGAEPDDVVWDPFVGSGGELCERGRLGPTAALMIGTDIDPTALAAAERNLAAAGLQARLVRTDARDFDPSPRATLILSNPPMGRRVLRGEGDVRRLLIEVVLRTRATLVPGGRVVLASAHPEDTRLAAQDAGLTLVRATTVDLGGFDVELQQFARSR